jgi:hypothetical protein
MNIKIFCRFCFLPGRAKDLSAPLLIPFFWDMTLRHVVFGTQLFETTQWSHLEGALCPVLIVTQ